MKLAPIYSNITQQLYGAFMEGALPATLNYDLQTVLNNMVTARSFTATPSAGLLTAVPNTVPAYQVSPAPAWTTVQGYRGKRVLPKLSFPTYSSDYNTLLAAQPNLSNIGLQLDNIFFTTLIHRCSSTTAATTIPCAASSSVSLPMPRVQNTDGSWTMVEYDFGADVTINSLAALTYASGANNIFSGSAANMLFLQVQNGSSWTDVTNMTTNLALSTVGSEKYYALPSTVSGRRFRIVTKAASVSTQWSSGFSEFALHFYGDYNTGASPRTLAKIGHMVGFMFNNASTYGTTVAISNPFGYNFGRIFNHFGLSVTDDLKLASANDILIPDAGVVLAQEQLCPTLSINLRSVTLETY